MILPIHVYGSDVLRANSQEIDFATYEGLQELIANMQETMERADGVGIAAPQVGLAIRLLIVDGAPFGEDDPDLAAFRRVMINPVLLEESEETADYSEGCLSVPGLSERVKRSLSVTIRYFDENWQEHTETYTGFPARAIQHEYDHLLGTVYVDKISPIRKQLIGSKLTALTKGKVSCHYKYKN